MRYVARPNVDPAPLEACRASMRDWLVSLLVWLLEAFEPNARANTWIGKALIALRREIDLELREVTRDLRLLLIANAYARLPAFIGCAFRTTHRPASIPPGSRRAARRNSVKRRFVGGALKGMNAGTLRERATRLNAAFDNLEPLIEAVLAQMTAMFANVRGFGLILIYARDVLSSVAPPPAPRSADTS